MTDPISEDRLFTGKLPATPGAVSFKFARYFDEAALPTPPRRFGRSHYVKQPWGELGNDLCGNCVWAGGDHETMLLNAVHGVTVRVTAQNAISDYSAMTGYRPGNPLTDRGTDMSKAADYRRTTGLIDSAGVRHKIDAYVSMHPGDFDTIKLATYLFGAVGFGFVFPSTAKSQFIHEQPWDVVPGAFIDGGHYVPIFDANSAGNLVCCTWGRLQAITPNFVSAYNDEALAYLSLEWLDKNTMLNPDNFDRAALVKDLAALAA
jgi:hypothetical protein